MEQIPVLEPGIFYSLPVDDVPILAHVERYHVLREEGRLEELADTGARIQMNYSSIDGG